ncbi:hypothetical protein INT43_001364 [Umbelopsis isabellina]|uniref:Uncharacterized protein n=1 Tax=Mortierella isabellina TaxID=91625 RepID=A0A8H7UBQ6_MORIS|nr:hypothetical protein INT43_001364 [Umbelopsis isabellina]
MELPDSAQNSATTNADETNTEVEWGDQQDFDNDFGNFNQFGEEDDDFGDFAAGTAEALHFEGGFEGPSAYVDVLPDTQSVSHDLVGQAPQTSRSLDKHIDADFLKEESDAYLKLYAQESNNSAKTSLHRSETIQFDDVKHDHIEPHRSEDDDVSVNLDRDNHNAADDNSESERDIAHKSQTDCRGSLNLETAADDIMMIKIDTTTDDVSTDCAGESRPANNTVIQSISRVSVLENDFAIPSDEHHNDEHSQFRVHDVHDEQHINPEVDAVIPNGVKMKDVISPELNKNENSETEAEVTVDLSTNSIGKKDVDDFAEFSDTNGTAGISDINDTEDTVGFEHSDDTINTDDFEFTNDDDDDDGFGDFGDAEATDEFGDFGDVEEDQSLENGWEGSPPISMTAHGENEMKKPSIPLDLQSLILSANFKKSEVAISVWDNVLGYLVPLSKEHEKTTTTNETETVEELVKRAHESLYPIITWHALTVNTDDDNGIPKVQWRNSRIEKMYLDALNASREPKIASPIPPSRSSPTVKPGSFSATNSPKSNVDTPKTNVDTPVIKQPLAQKGPEVETTVKIDEPVEILGVSVAQSNTVQVESRKPEEKVAKVPKITTSRLPASDSAPASAASGKELFHLSSVMSPPLANDESPPRPVPIRHASSPAIHAEPVQPTVNENTAVSAVRKSDPRKRHTMEVVPQQARSSSPLSQSFKNVSYSRPLTPTKFSLQSQTMNEISPVQSPKMPWQSSPNASRDSLGSPSLSERIQSPESERLSMDLGPMSETSSQPDISSLSATSPPAVKPEVQDSWLSSNDISFLDTLGGHSGNKPKSKPSSQKLGLGIFDLDIFEAANSPAPNSKPSSTTSAWDTMQDTRQKRGPGSQHDIFYARQPSNVITATLTKSPPARSPPVRSSPAKSTWANPVRNHTISGITTASQKSPPVHSQSPPSNSAFNGFGDFGDFSSSMVQTQPVSSPPSDSRWDVFRSASLSGSLSEWSTELTTPKSPPKHRESNASNSLNVVKTESIIRSDDDEFGDFSTAEGDGFGDFGSATTTWDPNQAYQFPSDPSKGWI